MNNKAVLGKGKDFIMIALMKEDNSQWDTRAYSKIIMTKHEYLTLLDEIKKTESKKFVEDVKEEVG